MMNGEIWWVDFEEPFGSEPGFKRPAVVPLTTNIRLGDYEGNVLQEGRIRCWYKK